MTDTLTKTTDTIIEAIANVSTTVVEQTSNEWNYLTSFGGYWLPAIVLICTAFFFRRFMFSNSSITYCSSFENRNKEKDTRFRNIYVVLITLVALCPYVNWFVIVGLIIACGASASEDMFPFYLNKEKFYSDKLMNFLFNGEMEKTDYTISNSKNSMKDL